MINDQTETSWACDVPVSLPEPTPISDVLLNMGTHVFTENGLMFNVTKADLQEYAMPTWGPQEVI